ncbi:MAG: LLM class flavin-dependent oxidoreductase [Streptosporangiaceae bacterium]
MRFHWFLPTSGDGHDVRTAITNTGHRPPARPATVRYLTQVARAAEDTGFDGILTPRRARGRQRLRPCALDRWPRSAYRLPLKWMSHSATTAGWQSGVNDDK